MMASKGGMHFSVHAHPTAFIVEFDLLATGKH